MIRVYCLLCVSLNSSSHRLWPQKLPILVGWKVVKCFFLSFYSWNFRPQAENHDGWLKDSNLILFEISDPHRVQNAKWCFMVEIFCGFLFQEKNKIKVLYPLTAPKMDLPWNMLGYTVVCCRDVLSYVCILPLW